MKLRRFGSGAVEVARGATATVRRATPIDARCFGPGGDTIRSVGRAREWGLVARATSGGGVFCGLRAISGQDTLRSHEAERNMVQPDDRN